jgi:hypothetical protein
MFRLFEKIFAILAIFPPVYMLYRYCRWYVRSADLPAAQQADD